jgi:AraC-like DNA-binding protein
MFQKRIEFDMEHELHMHDLLEINVLLENRAEFRLLDRQYIGDSGDVFIFRPYDPHYNLVKDPGKPITWIMVLFSPSIVRLIPYGYRLLYPFYTGTVHPHILRSTAYALEIHAAAKKAVEEQEMRLPAWESRQFMHFIDILSTIYRYAMDHVANNTDLDVDTGVISAVEYILRHITEEIDVNNLIHLYGKGKTHFYTTFKNTVGVTPNQFIHRLRMQIAIYLLSATVNKITDIAYECGYNSIHYFNKLFKQYQGISPREYRKSSKVILKS